MIHYGDPGGTGIFNELLKLIHQCQSLFCEVQKMKHKNQKVAII